MRDYWAGSLRRTPRLAVSIGACLRISHRLHASVHLSIADILITIDLRKVTISSLSVNTLVCTEHRPTDSLCNEVADEL